MCWGLFKFGVGHGAVFWVLVVEDTRRLTTVHTRKGISGGMNRR